MVYSLLSPDCFNKICGFFSVTHKVDFGNNVPNTVLISILIFMAGMDVSCMLNGCFSFTINRMGRMVFHGIIKLASIMSLILSLIS